MQRPHENKHLAIMELNNSTFRRQEAILLKNIGQDFRGITLYINYAYIYCSKKTNRQNNTKPLGFHVLFKRYSFFYYFF